MKNFKHFTLLFLTFTAFSFSGCDKDPEPEVEVTDPFEQLIYVGVTEVVGAGAVVKLYAEESLFVGYNNIYAAIYDSADHSKQITKAEVTFVPMMDMGTMQHSCPVENPTGVDSKTGAFVGAVVFVMPSSTGAGWTFNLDIENHQNGSEGHAALAITVEQPDEERLISFLSDIDSAQIYVAQILPTHPIMGLNNIRLGIYTKKSMMEFPEVNDFSIEMEPMMPSMGHGSSSNENPRSTGNGYYDGIVNYSMSGTWEINLDFKDSSENLIKADQQFINVVKKD